MLTDFHFIRPYWLFALIPCFILIYLIIKHKLQRGSWANVCDKALLPFILQQKPVKQSKMVLITTSIAAVLSIIALAAPTWERLPVPVFRNDSGLIMILDLSRSMLANDIKPNRLIRARYKIADILEQRKEGQTALIVYTGDAFVVTPLTEDTATIAGQLSALTPDIMPSSGSNVVLALEKAITLFKQAGLQKGHILLMTDGVDLDKTSDFVDELMPYKLSVLAVGTEDGAPIKLAEGGFLKNERGEIVISKTSLADLKKLASVGGGIGLQITDDDSDVKKILSVANNLMQSLGKEPQEDLLLKQWKDKGVWLLLLVLPLVALNFRRGLLVIALLIFLPIPKNSYAMEWDDLWQTNNQQAQQAYQQKDYKKAAEKFDDPNWKATAQYKAGLHQEVLDTLKEVKSTDSFYNQGNALAKTGQLAKAVKSYDESLKLDPNNEDAVHNKKIVEEALKKQEKEKKEKEEKDSQDKKSEDEKESDPSKKEGSDDEKESKPSENKSDEEEGKQDPSESDPKKPESQEKQDEKADESKQSPADKKEKKPEQEPQEQPAAVKDKPIDEGKQADEQWLQRIPDDPAGLLRRKFQYQYKLRKRKKGNNAQAW